MNSLASRVDLPVPEGPQMTKTERATAWAGAGWGQRELRGGDRAGSYVLEAFGGEGRRERRRAVSAALTFFAGRCSEVDGAIRLLAQTEQCVDLTTLLDRARSCVELVHSVH